MNVIAHRHFDAPILLADADAAGTGRMEGVLRNVGYRNIRTTSDFGEVESLFAKWPFSLLIVTVAPGGGPALDVIARLGTTMGEAPAVLAVLEGTDAHGRERVVGLGVRDSIIKPYTWPELVSRVRNALEIRHIGADTNQDEDAGISA